MNRTLGHKSSMADAIDRLSEEVSVRSSIPESPLTPAQVLRLTDAGGAQAAWITLLTTEHYNLQTKRAATISEANGRASVFIGAVSAGLIALGFHGGGHDRSASVTVFDVLVLTSLVFLGVVSFLRCLEIAIDDWEFAGRIAHLRAAYAQLVPELTVLLAASWGEEKLNMMLAGRWRPLRKMLSVAGSIAVITGVVLGSDVGVLLYGLHLQLYAAIGAGVVVGAVFITAAAHYQWARWCEASPAAEYPAA
ncbi:hypothetical protein HH310_28765 [Actinoplanes sp. TBRC 11911]|uniref:hypothetical protein n=1 Tax=Actinoplanes sp. TBRC 11911 TaxID=2729386 RepID=UPI00145CBA3A|nr:hypothetical protein [Actinoplanes sp. TBRC 11911]NMO55165.1 hypothetical protein [Actinoplanes sp. TBRC 11911]